MRKDNDYPKVGKRQINNRIKQLFSDFPVLVNFGKKGRGKESVVHPILIPALNSEKRKSKFQKEQCVWIKNYEGVNYMDMFNRIPWNYFVCFLPKVYHDWYSLINSVPICSRGDVTFFSIHESKKKFHIHYVFKGNCEGLYSLASKHPKYVLFIKDYNKALAKDCFEYLSSYSKTRSNHQKVVMFGVKYRCAFGDYIYTT